MRSGFTTVILGSALMVMASSARGQETKIVYNLTSPTPTVAEAPHASVPAVLGFWKEAGLDVAVNPTSGSTQAVQLVTAGTSHFTMATVEPLIIGRQKGAKIVAIYNHTREPIYTIAVQAESSITSLEQVKGKKIGVLSLSSGAVPFSKAMLASIGIDPEKDVSWLPIGIGQQSVHALKNNMVDAVGYWDWGYAIMENGGIKFRHFTTPKTKNVLSLAIVANEDFLNANQKVAVGFAQGIAKATLFTLTNPEAAVRIHWEKYPQSKPTGIPEDQALREAVHVLNARVAKYRIDNREVKKWGAFTAQEWVETQDFLLDSKLITTKADVAQYYTDKHLEQINAFDQAAIIAKAKAYK